MKNLKMPYNLLFFAILTLVSSNKGYAQTGAEVRAKWIFNIAPGVTWENEENISKYTIGVFSSNNEFIALKKLAETRLINGKPVDVVKYENYKDVKPNHIVFVTKNENANLGFIYQKLKGKNVLIISDRSRQPDYSVINFNHANAKQPFTINGSLYRMQKLKLSLALIRVGGDRQELKKMQNETNKRLLFDKQELEKKKIEIEKTDKELTNAKRDLKIKDKEIEVLKEKLRKCEQQKQK